MKQASKHVQGFLAELMHVVRATNSLARQYWGCVCYSSFRRTPHSASKSVCVYVQCLLSELLHPVWDSKQSSWKVLT